MANWYCGSITRVNFGGPKWEFSIAGGERGILSLTLSGRSQPFVLAALKPAQTGVISSLF